jgi:hypothetical protein
MRYQHPEYVEAVRRAIRPTHGRFWVTGEVTDLTLPSLRCETPAPVPAPPPAPPRSATSVQCYGETGA